MPATLIIGTQWGDEGKAKVIDYLSNEVDIVARYQGGGSHQGADEYGYDGNHQPGAGPGYCNPRR